MDQFGESISREIQKLAEKAELRLIPEKSRDAYCKEYEKLLKWMESKNSKSVNESLMLAYMMEMSSVYKSSTLWCIHSKLQAMLRLRNGVDLASFHKLHAFMKAVNKGYEAKKSFVFTEEELCRFFVQAPDDIFLFLKVVAICGVFGSCRRYEMCDLRMSDIKKEGSALIINIRPSKTEKGRKFAIIDDSDIEYDYVKLFNKYLSLRPKNVHTDRVFLRYANGKCIKQAVGINTFGRCPSLVAHFLKLPDSARYTGHAFRRTSATIMTNGGMSVDEVKRQVGWRSSTVAASYIEESVVNKLKVSKCIAGVVNGTTTTSSLSLNTADPAIIKPSNNELETAGIHISNNNNCTFNIYLK